MTLIDLIRSLEPAQLDALAERSGNWPRQLSRMQQGAVRRRPSAAHP